MSTSSPQAVKINTWGPKCCVLMAWLVGFTDIEGNKHCTKIRLVLTQTSFFFVFVYRVICVVDEIIGIIIPVMIKLHQ